MTVTYYFNSFNAGEAWADTPANFADGSIGSFTGWEANIDRVQLFDGNECDGTNLGSISKVELRVHGKVSGGATAFMIRPVFGGGDGDNHGMGSISFAEEGDWSAYVDVTSDTNAPGSWSWSNIQNLDCDIQTMIAGGSCAGSKVEVRVTYTEGSVLKSNQAVFNKYYY